MPSLSSPTIGSTSTPAAGAAAPASGVPLFLGYGDPGSDGRGAPLAYSAPIGLSSAADFAALLGDETTAPNSTEAYLTAAVRGFFDCGGRRCLVAILRDVSAWEQALEGLGTVDDFDLIAAPSLARESAAGGAGIARVCEVQAKILHFCTNRKTFSGGMQTDGGGPRPSDCFAILDAAPVTDVVSEHLNLLVQAVGGLGPALALRNGALYHPWIRVAQEGPFLPASGHIAGVYAASDAAVGAFKAPANAALTGVTDVAVKLSSQDQDALTGVNCLRAFPGRGICVWGARTLLAATAKTLDKGAVGWPWIFINVQRLFIATRRWLEQSLRWAVFEPHNLSLWNRVIRQVRVYLGQLYQAGALAGPSADQAFFIRCDAENNPPATRALGQLVVDVGLAPLVAGELILLRLTQSAASATTAQTA